MANPDYIRPELVNTLDVYRLVSDCYAGERAIKGGVTYGSGGHYNGGGSEVFIAFSPYLPDPSPKSEKDEVRASRYRVYLDRAVFYNVTRRTVKALAGAVFAKYPMLALDGLEYLEQDIDGSGQALVQQAKKAFIQCLLKGRGGLLADMPVTADTVTKADMVTQGVRATVKLYEAESIINWRTSTIGANTKLSLVVLSETYIKSDDGFKHETGEQLLVLRLEDGQATSEIYQKSDSGWQSQGKTVIKGNNGQALDEIPFYFFGADNNDSEIDDSPMYDIAQLNVAHFKDSADYQESNFIAGQPTLVLSGLTQQWVDDNLKNGVTIGARSGLLLPQASTAQLLQAMPNSVNFEAMEKKEAQMISLGAKLIEESTGIKTATEASSDNAEETSVLTNIAYNLSDCYTKAVRMCANYVGVANDSLEVSLNTKFNFAKMAPQQRQQLMAEWQAGAISWAEYRSALFEDEIATIEDPETAKAEIDATSNDIVTNGLGGT